MSGSGAGLSLRGGEEIVFRPAPGIEIRLAAITTPPTPLRDNARRLCREALRGLLAAQLGGAPEGIELIDEPGQPLRVLKQPEIGISISHESALSLVAVNFAGPVGVDLLKVENVPTGEPELMALCRDYLGPETAAQLVGLAADQRCLAFARAWTRHEARLKCLGRGLVEWHAASAMELSRCKVWSLDLPVGHAAALALLQID